MSNDLGRRLSALETRAGVGDNRVDVVIRRIVKPGPNGGPGPVMEPTVILMGRPCSNRLERAGDESVEAFRARALRAVRAELRPGEVGQIVECAE